MLRLMACLLFAATFTVACGAPPEEAGEAGESVAEPTGETAAEEPAVEEPAMEEPATEEPARGSTRGFGDVVSREWALESFARDLVLEGTRITIEFSEEGRAAGSGGCNRYTGSYDLGSGDEVSIAENLASTQMACPSQIMQQENQYFQALASVAAFGFSGDRLELEYDDGVLTFVQSME